MQLLTNSRMACARTCLRKHFIRYECGIRHAVDDVPRKIGSAFHRGRELDALGRDGLECVREFGLDQYDEEVVLRLLVGHRWRWESEPLEILAGELPFDLPLTNPETGGETPIWRRAGKIDAIVRLPDGRLALLEHKTTSEDVSPGSEYWTRVRIDQQNVGYFIAARELGYDVQTVIYDVVRKPSIQPRSIPLVDADGVKIVLGADGQRMRTKDGKKWRESADAASGYVLQTRPETRDEYGERIREDMGERPEWYFARMEIPRLEQDVETFRHELWMQQMSLRAAQRNGHWFRNPASCRSFFGACEFLGICERTDLATNTPEGFVRLMDVHPELATSGAIPTSTATQGASPATTP